VHAAVPGDCAVLRCSSRLSSQLNLMISAELVSSVDLVAKEAKGCFMLAMGVFFLWIFVLWTSCAVASHLPGEAKSQGAHADAVCAAGIRHAVDVLCSWRHTCQGKLSHRERMQTPCAPPEYGRQISFLTLNCNLEICTCSISGVRAALVQRCAHWVERMLV